MTDLEKLKAVFDDIGVNYNDNGWCINLSSCQNIIDSIDLHFEDGKFTHID